MDIKGLTDKAKTAVFKYKYAAIVLVIGLALLLLPGTKKDTVQAEPDIKTSNQNVNADDLKQILQSVHGAGKVQVLLSTSSGEQILYQTDTDISNTGDSSNTKTETVIVTDSQKNETGLIKQVNPPIYMGAIVVCEGADSAAVKLAITQAVSKITGLGSDSICVLKMK